MDDARVEEKKLTLGEFIINLVFRLMTFLFKLVFYIVYLLLDMLKSVIEEYILFDFKLLQHDDEDEEDDETDEADDEDEEDIEDELEFDEIQFESKKRSKAFNTIYKRYDSNLKNIKFAIQADRNNENDYWTSQLEDEVRTDVKMMIYLLEKEANKN